MTREEAEVKTCSNEYRSVTVNPNEAEELPEEGRFVLLCFKEGKTCPHFRYQVGYLGTHDVEDNNFVKTGEKKVWYTNNFYYDFDEVIAWMPIPNYEE